MTKSCVQGHTFDVTSSCAQSTFICHKMLQPAHVLTRSLHVTVFGSGIMGSGIAQTLATHSHSVALVDVNETLLAKSRSFIASNLKRKQQPVDEILSRITTTTDRIEAVGETEVVIEAVIEDLEVKRSLFKDLCLVAPRSALFCTNTSSLSINEIAKATNRKDRVIGLHFFNPVPQMPLVEVVATEHTSQDTIERAKELCKSIRKQPVECKDTAGFIVNRLLVPYLMEAFRIVERGDAKMEDVDLAMKLGAGYPMGPFELADYVGLDTIKFITDGWYRKELKGNDVVKPVKLLDELVKRGCFGKKSGRGFYDYKAKREENKD